ncbi:MAG: diguanylate cyclase [Pseudomonadota bacterium]
MNQRTEWVPPSTPSWSFDEIDAALASGAIETAQRLAEAVVRGQVNDGTVEAGALLRLGYCDLALSKVERARRGARRAAVLFREASAHTDEVEALALWARAASVLGRSVEAVETALLATQLVRDLPEGPWTVRAHLSLAIAHGWAQSFVHSMAAFDAAFAVAARLGTAGVQLELHAERAWVQILRWAIEREDVGASTELPHEGMLSMIALDPPSVTESLTPGAVSSLPDFVRTVWALMSLWEGRGEAARRIPVRAATDLNAPSTAGWLLAAQSWVATELAYRDGDFVAAGMHASRMTTWAREVENLPLTALGHRIACAIYEHQGRADLAVMELRRQLACEGTMQALHLEGRADLVKQLISARQGALHIEDLAAKSIKFEKWAHEDTLTGIPNLRRFNQCLNEWSIIAANTDRTLCVALIDVDRFRDINNNFSYEIGNEALRGIAQEMVAHVRPSDLPARWGGDEFAILFRDIDLDAALQIAVRIQEAVLKRDWSTVAPGLKVSISVGVTAAQPGDDKNALIARSELTMYEQKLARRRESLDGLVQPTVLRKVASWLHSAKRVVIFVGSGTGEGVNAIETGNLGAWSATDRLAFGHVHGFRGNPTAFRRFWAEWRATHGQSDPRPLHTALVALSRQLTQVTVVTERVDGILQRAGADNVVELYGNAHFDRCDVCGNFQIHSTSNCLSCNAPAVAMRPDIALLGAEYNYLESAGVEMQFKRADVVLVVDSDVTTYPGAGMLEKARSRGGRIVMLGTGERTRRSAADVVIDAPLESALAQLGQALQSAARGEAAEAELTDDCFDVLCFLTGQRTDNFGFSFEQAMTWKDWEIERHLGTIPWIFPLTTVSKMNPDAPMPSRADFEFLAGDERVRSKVHEAYLRMLGFYGFEWRAGKVHRSPSWQNGFATWVVTPSHHDLFISRILASLRLFGLRSEALAFLEAVEIEVREYRGGNAQQPLWHWRLAVHGGADSAGP